MIQIRKAVLKKPVVPMIFLVATLIALMIGITGSRFVDAANIGNDYLTVGRSDF
jgi:hypothetical protein